MPKKGMTGITLRDDVAQLLRSKAAANSQGLNDYLLSLMMGPSLQHQQGNPRTVPTQITTSIPTPIQTQNNETPTEQPRTPLSLSEGSLFAKRESSVVGLPGFGPGSREPIPSLRARIDYSELRVSFIAWVASRKLNRWYQQSIISHLDRFVKEPITGPNDIVQIFGSTTSQGQQNNLIIAMYNLLKFCRLQGFDREWLILLRENLPKQQGGMDIQVPTPEQVVDSLRVMAAAEMAKHRVAYNIAVDSGLRITEIARVLCDFDKSKAEHGKGFWILPVQFFRKSKLSYFAFVSDYTFELLRKLSKEEAKTFTDKTGSKYTQKRPVVDYKYLRKFVFDTMTDEKMNIPESVADFIEGRTPKSVGARHYMRLKRKAAKFYPRYARYIAELRQKALN